MSEIFETQLLYLPDSEELRFLPEGPYPCGDRALSWVAIQHGATASTGSINILDLATQTNTRHDLPGRPGFAFPTSDAGVFLVGCEKTVGFFHTATGQFQGPSQKVQAEVEGTIINDGLVWEDFVIFGTKDLEFKTPKAGLFFWSPARDRFTTLALGQTCSNGKAIVSRENELFLLDIDTPTKSVVEYPLNAVEGKVGSPRTVLDLKELDAFPDGMILTPDGLGVIIAMYNPNDVEFGEARWYDIETGKLKGVWRTTGSPRVTCPQLLSWNGRVQLVLTTAVEHMPEDQRSRHKHVGGLFIGETPFATTGELPVFNVESIF